MLKNAKAKGSRNERKTRDLLLLRGYDHVMKAGGSLGIFDLIGIGPSGVVLVQVKTNGLASPKERALIFDAEVPSFCKKELWVWYDRVKEPRILRANITKGRTK